MAQVTLHRSLTLLVVSLFVACSGSQATRSTPATAVDQAPIQVSTEGVRRARVFTGDGGIEVTVVQMNDDSALIRIRGLATTIEDKVLSCKLVQSGSERRSYSTMIDGRQWYVFQTQQRWGRQSYQLYAPGGPRGGISLSFDDKKSQSLDVPEVLVAHEKQKRSGELDAIARFDRPATEKRHEAELARDLEAMARACQTKPQVQVDWGSIDDQTLLKYSVSGYCDAPLDALRHVCEHASGKRFAAQIRLFRCRFGNKSQIHLDGGALVFDVAVKTVNLDQKVREMLQGMQLEGKTLADWVAIDKTDVCYKDDKHVAILAPTAAKHPGLAYGDGERFFYIGQPRYLSRGWFFDPRQVNQRHNSNMRGYDLRYYSYLEVERQRNKCKLVCGTRTTEMTLAGRDKVQAVLARASYQPAPHQRRPYALARSRRGVYFYVDRGITENTKQDFRVYRGPRGRLRSQPMKDIVSDSEGEIFATKNGKLRLVLRGGNQAAWWIARGKRQRLVWVPVEKNLNLIYNELGIYLGKQLGVPCDDF